MKQIANKWVNIIKKRPYVLGLLLIGFILIIYLPALNIYLRGDDFELLNESYGIGKNPALMFEKVNFFFRPLVKLSYFLNYNLFKTQVPFYNLTNILIHLLNVFLLYILVFRISGKNHIAFLISLFYGTSPIYSEATMWCAARSDTIPLVFMLGALLCYNKNSKETSLSRHIIVILLALCALGAKETWMLLPFLAFSFLTAVKEIPFKTALRKTFPLFLLLALYAGYFIGLPLLSGSSAAPTGYAGLGILAASEKFTYLIFKYMGLTGYFTGAFWQYITVFLLLTGLVYRLIRTKNRLALWGSIWLLIGISITLPIDFAPGRYNYVPLVGFWIMAISFLSHEIGKLWKRPGGPLGKVFWGFRGRFFKKAPWLSSPGRVEAPPEASRQVGLYSSLKISRLIVISVTGIIMILLLTVRITRLQEEIGDYRLRGAAHKTLVDMYQRVKDKLPHDRPIVFADLSKRKAEQELIGKFKGYEKVLFVRERAIWQLVFLSPLANFAGEPFEEIMKPVPAEEYERVFRSDYTLLVFTDEGFVIAGAPGTRIREYYRTYGKLPDKVEVLRFVPVKN